MGREIEVKIPLTDDQYDAVLAFIKGGKAQPGVTGRDVSHLLKTDAYFSRYDTDEERKKNGEPKVIRIRTEQVLDVPDAPPKQAFFCLKYKKIENDVEFNSENETAVEDENPLLLFFSVAGYKKYFEKIKDSYSVYCTCDADKKIEFHLELVTVNGHKYFEVEVTQPELDADRVQKGLEAFVSAFGLDVSKKDSRSWMQILAD